MQNSEPFRSRSSPVVRRESAAEFAPGRCFCLDAIARVRVVRRLSALSLIVPRAEDAAASRGEASGASSLVDVPPAEKFRRQIEAG
jgi:hypothetical protein